METRADQGTLARLDKEYVWHSYTQMAEYNATEPLVIVAGEGRKLKDAEGRWYYDGTSSIWLNVHGRGVPEITAAPAAPVASTSAMFVASMPPTARTGPRRHRRSPLAFLCQPGESRTSRRWGGRGRM